MSDSKKLHMYAIEAGDYVIAESEADIIMLYEELGYGPPKGAWEVVDDNEEIKINLDDHFSSTRFASEWITIKGRCLFAMTEPYTWKLWFPTHFENLC